MNGGIHLPPGAGKPLVGTDGEEILTENQIRMRELRAMEGIAVGLMQINQMLREAVPRFHEVGVAQANALGAVAMGLANVGLVELDEDEEQGEGDAQTEGDQNDGADTADTAE